MTRPGKPLCQGAEKCPPQGLPDRNAENSSACARPCASWQGPSPLPQRHADPWPAGGQCPSARARPAFTPATDGRWPRLVLVAPVFVAACRSGGETHAFPDPAQRGNPFPRIGKIFPTGRRSDCCLSTLSKAPQATYSCPDPQRVRGLAAFPFRLWRFSRTAPRDGRSGPSGPMPGRVRSGLPTGWPVRAPLAASPEIATALQSRTMPPEVRRDKADP